MSQVPTPRGPLGQLIDDAKTDSGKEWRDIEAGSGIPLPTIQSWTSGRSAEPPLRGVLHLARYLGVDPDALLAAALEGYVPPLRTRATAESSDPRAPAPTRDGSAGAASARAAQREANKRKPRKVRRPPSA